MVDKSDIRLASIAANVGVAVGKPLDATFGTVQQLRDDVLCDASGVSSTIVRHHMYAPLDDKTVHCFFERIGVLGTMSFYVTGDIYEAESLTPLDLTYVGSYPVTTPHVN